MQVTIDIPDELLLEIEQKTPYASAYLLDAAERELGIYRSISEDRQQAVRDLLEFAQRHSLGPDGPSIREIIEEGRRYGRPSFLTPPSP